MAVVTKGVVILVILGGLVTGADAAELDVSLRPLGIKKRSPFPTQVLIQITNDSFTSASLADKMKSSTLWIDGRPHRRSDSSFQGPAGLSPKSSWEGCVAVEQYAPAGLPPGNHTLEFQVGENRSKPIRFSQPRPAPAAQTSDRRLRQLDDLIDVLNPGLLKSCVENWLTEKDGGLQTSDQTRYYVDPGVKVVVAYQDAAPEPRVKGRPKLYTEVRIVD